MILKVYLLITLGLYETLQTQQHDAGYIMNKTRDCRNRSNPKNTTNKPSKNNSMVIKNEDIDEEADEANKKIHVF